MKKYSPSLLLLLVFSFISCDKDDDASFNQNLLLNKTWLVSALVVQQNGAEEDYYNNTMQECEKDNELIFFENGLYERNPGEESCTIDVEETGNWQLQGDKLIMVNQPVTVLALTQTSLKIQHESQAAGAKTVTTTTFTVK